MMIKRTGLLFGSFNPVHIGHMAVAGYMKEFAGMDEIWFIVSPQNPFKNPEQLATPTARLHMVRLATEDYPSFIASDIEFGMSLPSYTLNTMKKLTGEYPGRDYHIITGTDNIDSIISWKGGRTLLRDYQFLVYPRPGEDSARLSLFNKATIVNAPVIEVSSSFIRKALKEGKDMRAFVPVRAYEYLVKNRIYL